MMSGLVASPVWQMCRNGTTSVAHCGQDVAPAAEGGGARAAGVDDGRDAGVDAAEIGIDAGAVDALEDVGVQVDEPRGDDPTADLDHARGLGRRDAWRYPRDHTVVHRHVERAVEPARRVHDSAALQHEIVHAWPPKAARRMARAMMNLSGRAASYPFGPAATSQNLCDDALTMSKPAGRIHEIEHHAADWATTRPVVSGTQGVIAAGHPLVSMAGMRMLLAGGNAFDAAVAAGFAAAVVEPTASYTLCGECVALVYDARRRETQALSGQGTAPAPRHDRALPQARTRSHPHRAGVRRAPVLHGARVRSTRTSRCWRRSAPRRSARCSRRPCTTPSAAFRCTSTCTACWPSPRRAVSSTSIRPAAPPCSIRVVACRRWASCSCSRRWPARCASSSRSTRRAATIARPASPPRASASIAATSRPPSARSPSGWAGSCAPAIWPATARGSNRRCAWRSPGARSSRRARGRRGRCSCRRWACWPRSTCARSATTPPRYIHVVTEALKLAFADRERYYGDAGAVPLAELLSPAYARRARRAHPSGPGDARGAVGR